jgi:hypothetical protein
MYYVNDYDRSAAARYNSIRNLMAFNPFIAGKDSYKDEIKRLGKKAILACIDHKCIGTLQTVREFLVNRGVEKSWILTTYKETRLAIKAKNAPLFKPTTEEEIATRKMAKEIATSFW